LLPATLGQRRQGKKGRRIVIQLACPQAKRFVTPPARYKNSAFFHLTIYLFFYKRHGVGEYIKETDI
jgi:hypothetical protein